MCVGIFGNFVDFCSWRFRLIKKITKLVLGCIFLAIASYFFYPILLMILHYTVGGIFTELLNEMAMHKVFLSQAVFTTIFLIPGVWLLVKGFKECSK